MAVKDESQRQVMLFRTKALDRAAARKDDPQFRPATAKLLCWAEEDLAMRPPSVMDKQAVPPTDDKHDYMSLSPYTWPDPRTPDGLPYVMRDGEINPEVNHYDRPGLAAMTTAVHELALATRLTGERRYAAKAGELLRTWFLDEATRMNPHLSFAQHWPGNGDFDFVKRYYPIYVPGRDGKGIWCAFGGTIDGTVFTPMLESVSLLRGSGAWSERDHAALQRWFDEYLHWLLTSKQGRDEASCGNNHGTWHCVDIVSFALFCGRDDVARQWLTVNVPQRIASQFEPDGSQPEELVRRTSFGYVTFTLVAFCDLAMLGERLGVDLWNGEFDGRSLRRGIEWLAEHLNDGEDFPGLNIHGIDQTQAVPVLALAADAYGRDDYRQLIRDISDYPLEHRYRLLYPVD